ncbi:MAG: DUF6069 family protein [Acidimicrobiia bacterium]|nr:DUF6069 family protein [Acidimicrobiia bacterium]
MTAPEGSSGFYREPLVEVDLLRYWSTAVFSGLIVGFAAVVILRFAGDIFDTPLLVTERSGADALVPLSDGRAFWTAMIATGAGAAVLNLMLYVVPNTIRFFRALGSVVLLLSLLWPLTLDVGDAQKAWLVAIHLVVGLMIMSLLTGIIGLVTRPPQPVAEQTSEL